MHEDDRTARVLAVHEAAHAVATKRLGIDLERVELITGFWSGRVTRGNAWLVRAWDGSEDTLLAHLTILAVSRPAEMKFLRQRDLGDMSWWSHDRSCSEDDAEFESLRAGSDFTYGYVASRAEILVDRYWSEICETAELLLDRQRLSANAVK
ncbi:MAG: hypothetical protein WC054_00580 [Candidatus Nanopelagicales bacterium]